MSTVTPLFLDTTIQVDRVIEGRNSAKRQAIDDLLAQFNYLFISSYSRLEFKRVVIQNLALTLRYLVDENSFFGAMKRSQRLHHSRRGSTLVSILAFVGESASETREITQGEGLDEVLTAQAIAFIRNAIRFIWKRFDKMVDSVCDKTQCMRATEGPQPEKNGTFNVRIPESRCRQRECNNANFFRENLPKIRDLCDSLEKMERSNGGLTAELTKALRAMRRAEQSPVRLYDYNNCLEIGDLWIHLECMVAGVQDLATTNYKESQVLCPLLDLRMKLPRAD